MFKQREHPGAPPEISQLKLGCLVCHGSVTGDRLWLTGEREEAWLCRPVSVICLGADSASGLSLLLLFSRN